MNPKDIAATRAVEYIKDGMVVGLGTGSTAAFAIAALGNKLASTPLRIACVATSDGTAALAQSHNLTLVEWDQMSRIDVTIDGADEVDPAFRMIKGGGGALLREKIAASVTRTEIIIVDRSKLVENLGRHPLPIVVTPYGWQSTASRLEARFARPVIRRTSPNGTPFLTDDGLVVLDMAFGSPLPSPDKLEAQLKNIVGVVEVGLFVGLCQRLIIGNDDGTIEERVVG